MLDFSITMQWEIMDLITRQKLTDLKMSFWPEKMSLRVHNKSKEFGQIAYGKFAPHMELGLLLCLVMSKRRLKHWCVKCVENDSRKKGNLKTCAKKHNDILIPSQGYQDCRHLSQNPTFPNYVMGFSNRAQRFTGSNYIKFHLTM